jgi:hypothetical protein
VIPPRRFATHTRGRAAFWTALALLAAALPTAADAHVNRQVGPFAFLVVLVEEPTFEDDHAGFKFWVRRDEVPIVGLEWSVRAVATGHGQRVELAVPHVDGTGFYVLDHSMDGAAFDPLGGGAWTLELTGSVEDTPFDVTFPVSFPSYPRIGAANPAPAPSAAEGGVLPAMPLLTLLGGVAAVVVAAVALGAGRQRSRRSA